MAMRNYGVQSKCVLFTFDEFYRLCITQRKYVDEQTSELFKNFYDENNVPLDFSMIDFSDLIDITYNINYGCYFGDIDGSFTILDENGIGETEYFNGSDLIIIELSKNDLFDCYKDFNEIYDEIKAKLEEIGITVDRKYIAEHFGNFEGSYYA